jgi:cytoskeletal protein RodZ
VEVKLNVTEESWVAVEVDGEVVFEGTLPKGDQKAWKGKKQVTVSSGNAGGVSVSYNNAAAKPLGDSGDVKTVSFPPTP